MQYAALNVGILHHNVLFLYIMCDKIHIICNKVTKINFKVLHFVLCNVVYLLKQNTI